MVQRMNVHKVIDAIRDAMESPTLQGIYHIRTKYGGCLHALVLSARVGEEAVHPPLQSGLVLQESSLGLTVDSELQAL